MNIINQYCFSLHTLFCSAETQYKIKREYTCKTIPAYEGGKTYTDVSHAMEECTKRNGCKGVVNWKCKDEKYKHCKSAPLKNKSKESGHCVYQKSGGNYN